VKARAQRWLRRRPALASSSPSAGPEGPRAGPEGPRAGPTVGRRGAEAVTAAEGASVDFGAELPVEPRPSAELGIPGRALTP